MKIKFFHMVIGIIIFSHIMNILNSSVFGHNFSGKRVNYLLGTLLGYLRLPVTLIPIITFSLLSEKIRNRFFGYAAKNWDIVLFILSAWFSLVNSREFIGLFYTIWNTTCFTLVLLFTYSNNSKPKEYQLLVLAKILMISNFVVFPFLLINIGQLFSGQQLEMPFSHVTFYPYCVLSFIIGALIILLCKKLIPANQHRKDFFLKRSTLTIWGIIIFSFFILLASGRRTPTAVAFFALVSFIYILNSFTQLKRYLASLGLAFSTIIMILVLPFILENYGDKYSTLARFNKISIGENFNIEEMDHTSSYAIRLLIWDSYFQLAEERPIVGTGLYNGQKFHKKKFPDAYFAGYGYHNSYVGIYVEQGLLGISLFIIIFFRTLYIVMTQPRLIRNPCLVMIFALLLINWNEFNGYGGEPFFWTTTLFLFFPRGFIKPVI